MKRKYATLQQEIISATRDSTRREVEQMSLTAFITRCDQLVVAIIAIIESLPFDEYETSASDEEEVVEQQSQVQAPSHVQPEQPNAQSNNQQHQMPNQQANPNDTLVLASLMRDMMQHSERQMERLLTSLTSTTIQSNLPHPPENTKLPHIYLPTFDGDYTNWISFRDRFTSSVKNHRTLSDVQKLEYLKSAVTGNAESTIKHLNITAANFSIAWQLLTDRFERKNDIVAEHVRAFYRIPTLNTLNEEELEIIDNALSESVMALESMHITQKDPYIIQYVIDRLDVESRVLWGRQTGSNLPTVEQLRVFVRQRRADARNYNASKPKQKSSTSSHNNKPSNNSNNNKSQNSTRKVNAAQASESNNCRCCNQAVHQLYQCPKFLAQSPNERFETVKQLSLCRNCFAQHLTNTCTFHKCRKCKGRHNTLLHEKFATSDTPASAPSIATTQQQPSTSSETPAVTQPSTSTLFSGHLSVAQSSASGTPAAPTVFLATAMVDVITRDREKLKCRMLLDSGAELNIISTSLFQKLRLPKSPSDVDVIGVGQHRSEVRGKVSLTICSRITGDSFTLTCYIMPKLVGNIPSSPPDLSKICIPNDIQLADPSWAQPQPIDLLISGNLNWTSFLNNTINLGPGLPILRENIFGYVVVGEYQGSATPHRSVGHVASEEALDQALERFWNVETVPEDITITEEQKEAEEHFVRTHKRTDEGRFMVQLPFKKPPALLGTSRPQAIRQFLSVERKFERNPGLKQLYTDVIRDYMAKGWIEPVPRESLHELSYYMPHHGILKDSLTTKLRVVYNASAPTSTGMSLNDLLMVGPTVQPDLLLVLLRFRRYEFALTADISKMYLQLRLDPTQADFQRLVWREDKNQPIQDFRIPCVCFGVAASAFLATRALNELAVQHSETHPYAAKVLLQSFYVDDGIISAPSLSEAQQIQRELTEVLLSAGFVLTKWVSNNSTLIPATTDSIDSVIVSDPTIKALGVDWNWGSDTFHFTSPIQSQDGRLTKRIVASEIAKLFDPMGLIGPVIVEAKILLQQLHKLGLKWDDPLPEELERRWSSFVNLMLQVDEIRIPRWISTISAPTRVEIHAFADASQQAYGASIYVVTYDEVGNVSAQLLTSKCRVTPLKELTIPRLELCGALMATDIVSKIQHIYEPASIHFWSDSMIVLYWVNSPPNAYKVFVSNRVKKVLENSTKDQWRHVPSEENPADIVSRGAPPRVLSNSNLWWNGPDWLLQSNQAWPSAFQPLSYTTEESRRVFAAARAEEKSELERLLVLKSSFNKILRIIAYCYRFGHRGPSANNNPTGPISAEEMEYALIALIKMDQQEHFGEFLQLRKRGATIPKRWIQLQSLNPFMDPEGILRVGGRLAKSDLEFNAKHQVLLPRSAFTRMIIRKRHEDLIHAGPTHTIADIKQQYWPLSGFKMASDIYAKCYDCIKARPKPLQQIMGQLPQARVVYEYPFHSTGVDFAGPLQMLPMATRGVKSRRMGTQKVYIAVFVCMATKAVHLEAVTSLTTDAFIAALRRFSEQKWTPKHMYSDKGSNFIGAANEMAVLLTCENAQRNLVSEGTQDGIQWHFNPPLSPHHGGLWEACVKSTKYHLNRCSNGIHFTFEELTTVLYQIAGVLNSRPLCTVTEDPNSPILTPNHLMGRFTDRSLPNPDLSHLPTNRQSYWQACQAQAQEFGRKWRTFYLNTLQQRPKWRLAKENLIVGEVVLLLDEANRDGRKWVMGRIEEVRPGADGYVRVVSIRTSSGIYVRPITKIARLPTQDDPEIPAPEEQPGEYVPNTTN
uniref:Uncharacterized protein n=1 Tax=Nyssomyia neivai TaxID=330878 RepID=A0A1L8DIY5_9DIPT